MIRPAVRALALVGFALLVGACTTKRPAPIEDRSPAPRAAAPAPVPAPAPAAAPEVRVPTYVVKRGDTLRGIATELGVDARDLAAWNNIENPNVIRVGQVLRAAPPGEPATPAAMATTADTGGVQTMPLKTAPPVVAGAAGSAEAPPPQALTPIVPPPPAPRAADTAPRDPEHYKTQPKALKEPYSEQALRDMQRGTTSVAANAAGTSVAAAAEPMTPPSSPQASPTPSAPASAPAPVARTDPKPADDDSKDRIDWTWPAKGKVVTSFSETSSLKGIDIAGTAGQPVSASAGGKIVYAGTGLRGYGKLIIIKHNGTYLSAYAHNKDILVKEGQQVTKGQKIAEMGNTDADQVKLHFEIRRNGKPVDPLRYLPPA